MTTPLDLEELKRLVAEATPGPWEAKIGLSLVWVRNSANAWIGDTLHPAEAVAPKAEANARLIARRERRVPISASLAD